MRGLSIFWIHEYSIHLIILLFFSDLFYSVCLLDIMNNQIAWFCLITFLLYYFCLLVQVLFVIFEAFVWVLYFKLRSEVQRTSCTFGWFKIRFRYNFSVIVIQNICIFLSLIQSFNILYYNSLFFWFITCVCST